MRKSKELETQPAVPDWRELIGYEDTTQSWAQLIAAGRLPPVMLLVGREGLGKTLLLAKLAAFYLCEHGTACGHCEACEWLLNDSHPEVLWIQATQGKLVLEDASRLQEHLALSPGPGVKARIVVVVDADQLGPQAANRLLKTLEEPPPRTAILMSTSRVQALLPTVLSRCVRWRLTPPPYEQTKAWLLSRTHAEGFEHATPIAIERALKNAGLAPGKALSMLRQSLSEDDGKSPLDDLTERLTQTLAGPPIIPSQALAMAETLSKGSGINLSELTELYERSLNATYWQWCQTEDTRLPSVSVIAKRREELRQIKRLGRRERVPLNAQLAMEALALGAKV